jgi:hypothetical protein
MDTIDSKHVGTVDGFEINARIVPDTDARPDDCDCYDAEDLAAWQRDDWSYVGTIVTASREGIELGESSLWGSEYGSLPTVDHFVNPLDGTGDEFVNGYGPQLIAEAIEEAKSVLNNMIGSK